MKYYVIAGEKSGDLHAANLLAALKNHDSAAQFRGFGGDDMQAQGMTIVKHYRELAFMGFLEVIKNLRTIFKNIAFCKQDILDFKPDVVILVDYPGFNLRIAAFTKKENIPVFYYISPKVWAWNTKRAWKIKANVDRMFVIFPFEVPFYEQFGYKVDFVGNPLFDAIAKFTPQTDFLANNQLSVSQKIIAILPGSRRQELEKNLPEMLSVYENFSDYQFVIAGIDQFSIDFYRQFFPKNTANLKIKIIFNQTYDLLVHAEAALVTSGTATLETALLGIPQVVCYKMSGFTYAIAKNLVKVPYISLVNLVAQKEVVKELIQNDLNSNNLTTELRKIIVGGEKRAIQLQQYQLLKDSLGTAGASETTAKLMTKYLKV
ncbi:MAG: lipid-A-disaccharide synthase [Verrucomicrobia bacterium]|nr:lipid-A-disaccharide synthase [Cytophagales bacterium]